MKKAITILIISILLSTLTGCGVSKDSSTNLDNSIVQHFPKDTIVDCGKEIGLLEWGDNNISMSIYGYKYEEGTFTTYVQYTNPTDKFARIRYFNIRNDADIYTAENQNLISNWQTNIALPPGATMLKAYSISGFTSPPIYMLVNADLNKVKVDLDFNSREIDMPEINLNKNIDLNVDISSGFDKLPNFQGQVNAVVEKIEYDDQGKGCIYLTLITKKYVDPLNLDNLSFILLTDKNESIVLTNNTLVKSDNSQIPPDTEIQYFLNFENGYTKEPNTGKLFIINDNIQSSPESQAGWTENFILNNEKAS